MGLTDYAGGLLPSSQSGQVILNGNVISNVQSYVNAVASGYVLQPKGMTGIAGFIFDYEGDDEISLESEITDHYAENNSSVQDHIALKPYRVTLRGFVSELTLPASNAGLFGPLNTLQSTIGSVPAYLGKYTPQALQTLTHTASGAVASVQNYANETAQYLNQAQNIVSLFGLNSGAPTRQQSAFVALAALRDSRQVFSILTPWTLVKNMAIESLRFVQTKDTKTMSDIVVTMKQMRFVDINITGPNATTQYGGRAANQAQNLTQNGSTPGTPVAPPVSQYLTSLDLAYQ